MRRSDASPFPWRVLGDESGMTIAELLMAAFIGIVVLGASWGAVAVQGRSAAFQSGLADAQSSGRGAGTLLLQDLRMAGFGMLGVSADEDLAPLEYEESGGVTTLKLRGAFAAVQTTLKIAAAAGTSSITVNPPEANPFVLGEMVLVDSGLGSEVKVIVSVSSVAGDIVLALDSPLTRAYPIGPNVTQIEEIVYTWDGTILDRNGEVVADNAAALDLRFVDQQGNVTDEPGGDLRSVLVDLVAVDPAPLPDAPAAQSVVSTEVNVRNLAFRYDLG